MSVSLRILAADDQAEVTAYLQEYLGSLGHRVDAAANGIEALTLISAAHREQDSYHLLLIAARMPLLDGLSLVRELRRAKDPTDVAFLSGDPSMLGMLDNEAQHLGCLMVLSKPFDPAQLVQLVEFVAMRRGRRISSAGQTAAVVRNVPAALEPTAPARVPATPSPVAGDEYLPTASAHTARRERVDAPPADRRSQVFYPVEPAAPASPARTPRPGAIPPTPSPVALPPGLQNGTTTSHRQSKVSAAIRRCSGRRIHVTPRASSPAAHRYLAVAQDPRQAQDPRYSSRVGIPPADPRQAQLPPPQQPQRDPRYTSRVALPPAQPPVQPGPRLPPSIDPYARRATSRLDAPVATLPIQPGGSGRTVQPPRQNGASDPRQNGAPEPRRTSEVMPPGSQARPLPAPPPHDPQIVPPRSPRAEALDPNPEPAIGRMRRSIGGAGGGNQVHDSSMARMVACAHCGGSFRAAIKPQPYNLVCVHCGQLNRIDP